ncbi:NYN domain-containing protein, partial [bacterium]|nr:NYN domain-containing protein [bacterium]
HKHAIQPMQQFRYTVGKNATDSAMIIDAMDILHSNDVDGFGLVSSDSDYTRLATRIREEGLSVIGVGENKTPEAFVNACNQFIYCENLVDKAEVKRKAKKREKSDTPDPKPLLLQAFEMVAKEEEWVHLSSLGSVLRKLNPAFDPRTFGHERLQSLIKDYPKIFTLKRDDSKTPPVVFVGLTA